jgi:hypothetical protein
MMYFVIIYRLRVKHLNWQLNFCRQLLRENASTKMGVICIRGTILLI